MSWLFDGLGAQILTLVITLIVGAGAGGAAGYRIGKKKQIKKKQRQIARDYATQTQIGEVNVYGHDTTKR